MDDGGRPVADAEVGVSFEHGLRPSNRTARTGKTDPAGYFKTTSTTSGNIGYRITKQGYYSSMDGYEAIEEFPVPIYGHDYPRSAPLVTTQTVLLRKIIRPVLLLVRTAELIVSNDTTSASFDLLAGDWRRPFGVGSNADFIFTWSGISNLPTNQQNEPDWDRYTRYSTLQLNCASRLDGVIEQPYRRTSGSELRLPNVAPTSGYQPKRTWKDEYDRPRGLPADPHPDLTVAYFFRVRSQTNQQGEILGVL